jgi:tetratricopeptide (TPR) repeat protein
MTDRRNGTRALALLLASALLAVVPARVTAQGAGELVAQGNAAYDARDVATALRDYDRALAIDPHDYQALWRASRAGVDLGEFDPNAGERTAYYRTATERGRTAVQVNPNDAEGHFVLARALGREAQTLGPRDRVKYAKEILAQTQECLRLNPTHAGCEHVLGVWNAEIMRLNGFTRMIARNFLGGQVFGQASWQNAERYMVESVKNDPRRVVHRLDLARVYRDEGKIPQARVEYQAVLSGETIDYNDPHYKEQATAELKAL